MSERFVTVHSVGPHAPGEVIEFSKDDVEKRGVDVERLLRLGAIRKVEKDEASDAVPFGRSDPNRLLRPIPEVIHDPLSAGVVANETEPVKTKVSDKPKT